MKKKKEIINRYKIGNIEKDVLKAISLGLVAGQSLALPNLNTALKNFAKKRGPKGMETVIKRLKEKQLIDLGGEKIELTEKGQKWQKSFESSEMILQTPLIWDGIWHLVSYDIPNLQKIERDFLRQSLERWNFKKVQESLWVSPYDYKEEVAILSLNLGIASSVITMNTDRLPNQEKFERFFGVRK